MRRSVKISDSKNFNNLEQRVVVEQNGAKKGFLRLDALRGQVIKGRILLVLQLLIGHNFQSANGVGQGMSKFQTIFLPALPMDKNTRSAINCKIINYSGTISTVILGSTSL
jgi:hypothetical protein